MAVTTPGVHPYA
jgi:hypothetical protein